MQAPLPLSTPVASPPIAQLATLPLERLLLGCCQASRPTTLCHGSLKQIAVDRINDGILHRRASTPIIFLTPTNNTPNNAVNAKLIYQLSSSSPIRDPRLEITPPLTATNSTIRYSSGFGSFPAHSFEHRPGCHLPAAIHTLVTEIDASQLIMTTAASTPGSPPDLSGSRSSKSSSYCSTSPESSHDAIVTDVTNFEEIGLEEDQHGKADEVQRSSFSRSRTTEPPSIPSAISGPLENRPPLPNLQNQVREAVRQRENGVHNKKVSGFYSMRRGFSSPITPFAAGVGSARPRSSSPPKRMPIFHSTTALSADPLRSQWNSTRSALPSRRSSWQQRKSVQELEAEYHDSDDELPEDASLWNVPVSPQLGDRSARSSFHGSPGPESVCRSPRPIPLAHASTVPEFRPKQTHNAQAMSRLRPPPPRSSSLTTSFSNPSSPRSQRFQRNGRAKSWNLAMEDLSEEAKIISEALEHHSKESRRGQLGGSRASSSTDSVSTASVHLKARQIQLPPVQKGSLDFMPISKEKEAILSRTRPSWLPPKDPKEERRHLKEYQEMMAASLEAEKKKQDRTKSQECERDITRDALDNIWQFYCEESTDLSVIDKRVFDLCWRGISPKARGRVWQRAIGNPLGLTTRSFDKALARAKEIQGKDRTQLSERERHINTWLKDIERDAETAFPDLNVFQRHGPLWQDLIDVCKAYACYRSDIGYVYGQQLTAALLLLQVPNPAGAFILLANCFNRAIPLAFQSNDISMTARTYNHAVSILAIKFPRLHEYLFGSIEEGGLGFTSELIFQPMLRTLFCNGLDVDRLCRVWDLWVFEGDKSLVRSAVAVLGCLQSQLFEIQGDVDLRRRNIQEMLAWGPLNRTTRGGHWDLGHVREEQFVDEIRFAGKLDYRLR